MENIKRLIEENNLIKEGDVIGVGVSGGKDSMALLHYLNNLSHQMDFEVVAITIDHGIRENGLHDAKFVMDFCRQKRIRAYRFRINSPQIAKDENCSIETAARDGRYNIFKSLIEKNIVDKIALAHHLSDQAETVLLHLFRGSGITGLKGMQLVRDEIFIRPMLETSQKSIMQYILDNDIEIVEDETNKESEYARNYIRNEIMPLILKKWPNAINAIDNFAHLASEDDEYISNVAPTDAFIVSEKEVKIPLTYFVYPNPIVSRMVYKALHIIGIHKDIESKHIEIIRDFVKNSENGKKIDLPLKVSVHKEYDYITLTNKNKDELPMLCEKHKIGSFEVKSFGKIQIRKVDKISQDGQLFYDSKKLPKNAEWRFRQNGDIFEKFGGGTKKLKSYLIDQKYPKRLRDRLPVLAVGNEVYIIAGVEISNKIRVSDETTSIYEVKTKLE